MNNFAKLHFWVKILLHKSVTITKNIYNIKQRLLSSSSVTLYIYIYTYLTFKMDDYFTSDGDQKWLVGDIMYLTNNIS